MKAKLPISRAKTAYGLLSEVCRIITEEPLRYSQHLYLDRDDDRDRVFSKRPACGTVGCVAGWVATLKTERRFNYDETPVIASRVLGIDDAQAHNLFGTFMVDGKEQTPLHARNGVKHIRAFQKKYRAQLLAKKVR